MSKKQVTVYGCFRTYGDKVCVGSYEAIEHPTLYVLNNRPEAFGYLERVPKHMAFKTKQEAVEAFISRCEESVGYKLEQIGALKNQIEQAKKLLN